MNVLYTSQKLHELFCDDQFPVSGSDILESLESSSPAEESLPNHAHASGDGDAAPGRCCRLCGGDNNLRYFGDTYVWQGVEERYDELLSECFGVKVTPSDCMICEWCVRALRTTGRFRALVHAAFDDQISDRNEAKRAWEKLRNNHRDALRRQSKTKSGAAAANIRPWRFQDNMAFLIPHMANRYTHTSEEVQNDDTFQVSSSLATLKSSSCVKNGEGGKAKTEKDLQPTKPIDLIKRREERKRLLGGEIKAKRTNIPCDICKQRYPMLLNARDNYKTFVCSRCKKNGVLKGASNFGKSNLMTQSNLMAEEQLDLNAKTDLRGKFKDHERKKNQNQMLPRKVSPMELSKPRTQKYQCSQCSKKYTLARQLAMHVRNAHGDSMDNICTVCNQDMVTNEKLQEHLLQHSGLHQCDECLLIFKNKKTLSAHINKHHTGYVASFEKLRAA